jgi:hypothetical protein
MEYQMRNSLRNLALLGTILSLAASPVLAQGRGNSGATPGNAPGNSGNANAGGQSDTHKSGTHMSERGRDNNNGPNAADRAFGTDRAANRAAARTANDVRATSRAHANAANALGSLNSAHASANARANAAATSRVGQVATYETRMRAAMAITNPIRRDAAITAARQELAGVTNKELTPGAVARLDNMLSIQGASPQLGATR